MPNTNDISTYKHVIKYYENMPNEIREYFPKFKRLISNYDWDVVTSYVFARIEYVKLLVLYCGLVKIHRTKADLTWKVIDNHYISRDKFVEYLFTIYNTKLPKELINKLDYSEKIRDKLLHGKDFKQSEVRKALVDILDFSQDFNTFIYDIAGFKPFGSLKGFKGRSEPLSSETTRWVLKGMGFILK